MTSQLCCCTDHSPPGQVAVEHSGLSGSPSRPSLGSSGTFLPVKGRIMATVTYDSATRIYPGSTKPAVDSLDLENGDGEFLVLVGPSGCGNPPRSACSR